MTETSLPEEFLVHHHPNSGQDPELYLRAKPIREALKALMFYAPHHVRKKYKHLLEGK